MTRVYSSAGTSARVDVGVAATRTRLGPGFPSRSPTPGRFSRRRRNDPLERDRLLSGLRGWSRGLLPARSAAGDDGDVDIDVSVFQFTLGIPGLPDEQVPRILGLVTCVLLVLNHMSTDVVEAAQARSEVVALLLGATCIALPTLNRAINFNNSSILSQAERTVRDLGRWMKRERERERLFN